MDKVLIQIDDFDLTTEVKINKGNNPNVGAIVSFVGTVRELQSDSLNSLTLEHYPEMTKKSLESIVLKARSRWQLENITVIHRVGKLLVSDQIVLVIVTSKHRQEAFDSCNFIMDYLKTDAPFWKKESSDKEEKWVDSRSNDEKQKKRWEL